MLGSVMDEEEIDDAIAERCSLLDLPMALTADDMETECSCAERIRERRRRLLELPMALELDEEEIECTCVADKQRALELVLRFDFDEGGIWPALFSAILSSSALASDPIIDENKYECPCVERKRSFLELPMGLISTEQEIECSCRRAFFDLPTEIRVMIYECLFKPGEIVVIDPTDLTCCNHRQRLVERVGAPGFRCKRSLPFLRTCRRVLHEAGTILYGDNTFHFPHQCRELSLLRFFRSISDRNRSLIRKVKVEIHVEADVRISKVDWKLFSHVTAETLAECGIPRAKFGLLAPLTSQAFSLYKVFAEFALEGTGKTFSIYMGVQGRSTFTGQTIAIKCFLLNLVDLSSLMEMEHPGYAVDRTGIYPEPKGIARVTETLDEVCVTFPQDIIRLSR